MSTVQATVPYADTVNQGTAWEVDLGRRTVFRHIPRVVVPDMSQCYTESLRVGRTALSASKTVQVATSNGDEKCVVQCFQCKGKTRSGSRCTRPACMTLPFCWQHTKTVYGVERKDSQYGKGLFAAKRFPKDSCIVLTDMDKVMTEAEHNVRWGEGDDYAPLSGNVKDIYQEPIDGIVVDPTCYRSIWSFANHRTRPNAEADIWGYKVNGRWRACTVLYARTNIRPGQEIVFDYGRSPSEDLPLKYKRRKR